MKLQKLYFDRHYDQWKGLPVSIEEEVNGYGLYIQSPDLKDIDRIKENGQFFAIFEKLDEVAYGEVYDVDKRILRLEMPPEILSKDGLYTVTFTTSYKKNEETIIKNSAIQSFSILDIIEVSDEYIENYDKYSLLNDLLKNVQDTEIDTTMFAKTEEVEKLIEDALNGVDLNTILKELEIRDLYMTEEKFELELNTKLKDYVTKFETAQYAKTNDLNAYTKTKDLYRTLSLALYAKTEDLNKYILKEEGKTLTSNDFTNELKEKLEKIPENGNYDDTELREEIDTKASISFVKEYCKDIVIGDNFYDKTYIDEQLDDINNIHENDILNIEENYLKKEDYQYTDGIQTDDVISGEKTLTEILEDLTYKEIEINNFQTTLERNLYEFLTESLNEVTLKWELNKNPISQKVEGYNGEILTTTRELIIPNRINSNKDFTLVVEDEKGVIKTSTVSINFVFPVYYGSFLNTLDVDIIQSGNKILTNKEDKTIDMSYTNSKIYFAIPKDLGMLADIKDGNGLSYIDDFILNEIDYSFNGTSYNVYTLENKATVKRISYSLIFKKEEE